MKQGGKSSLSRDPSAGGGIFRDPSACRPLLPDPGVYGTPLSGSWCLRYPTFGILVVSRPPFRDPGAGGGIFRDPGGSAAPLSASRCLRYPTFGIQVGLRPLFRHPGGFSPPLRDPGVFAPRPSGSWWGILWRHSVSCGARAVHGFKSHAVSPGCFLTAG